MNTFIVPACAVLARGCAALLLALVAAAGCGSSHPPTVRVSGRITYEGKPLEAGEVAFQPTLAPDGALLRPAVGPIGPDGTYVLSTFAHGDGIVPGEYAVVVTSYLGDPLVEELDPSPPPRPSRIPLKYASPATSGLQATIPANARGRLTFDFDLE